ncbi:hypothetical protein P692DRAFT_20872923 [Suillus brevipes Sb2]|nr:hypothetical protein P692DRAFT_20872923 [Suillus brevipes Sb2]
MVRQYTRFCLPNLPSPLPFQDGHFIYNDRRAHIISPISQMNLPWNCIPTLNQLAADHWQDVLDDGVHYTFVNQTPPPQIDSYSTVATNILPYVSNFGSWNNTPTLHSTQYHNPTLGGASIRYSSFPALESGYSSPLTSQEVYPNGRSLQSNISSQHTVTSYTPFVLDPTMPASDFLPYNILPHQWQTHAVPQQEPLSLPVTPMIPPPLVAEPSRFISVIQPHIASWPITKWHSNKDPENNSLNIGDGANAASIHSLISSRFVQII